MSLARSAGMRCPRCGKTDLWFNDVPLRAFCWGDEAAGTEHAEWSALVPPPFNPYLPPNMAAEPNEATVPKRRRTR